MTDTVQVEDDQEAILMREKRLENFSVTISKQRDEWIRSRYSYGVDKRWVEDEDQYNNKDNVNKAASQMMTSVEQGYPVTTQHAQAHRSTVFIGMTRQKTNAAEARLADIVLPTDDRNWGIKPTPVPHIVGMLKSDAPAIDTQTGAQLVRPTDGAPLTEKVLAKAIHADAMAKAEAMQTEIDDQLTECDYNSELRKTIHDSAVLGTGVIKGPVVTNRYRKAWNKVQDNTGASAYQIEFVKEQSPASYRVDPRNLWPDPACGDNIHNGKGIYERKPLTAKQVRELAKQPGYMKEQLRKVLEEGPKTSPALQEMRDDQQRDLARQTFEMWEYTGEVDYEDLIACGVELPDDDILKSISACVVIINSTVVKAYLNPLEGGDLPYDFYPWEKVSDSVWGYGIPRLMSSQQKVLNAAWRQMMDNSGVSSGPQIVLKPGCIQPADKQWALASRKIWYATDDVDDVTKAFTTFEFDNHQAELQNIIKLATELADQETGVPVITQGEKGAAPDTVGGMQMLMNSAGVVLRRLVKQFDDMVTKNHIRRYYDYNMLYNEREDIKGDFTIDARGSSVLMIRDIQNQAFLTLLNAAASPIYGDYIDPEKLFRKALQAQHIDPVQVFKSDEELTAIKEAKQQAANQPPPEDPRIVAAKLRAEADLERTRAQNDGDAKELELRREIQANEATLRMQELQVERELEMLKLANNQHISLEEIKAKLAEIGIKERTRIDLFKAERDLKMRTGEGI